jgi:hypothetical protein
VDQPEGPAVKWPTSDYRRILFPVLLLVIFGVAYPQGARYVFFISGVCTIWLLSLVIAFLGGAAIATQRIRWSKDKDITGWAAIAIGLPLFLLGLIMSFITWPPLLLR